MAGLKELNLLRGLFLGHGVVEKKASCNNASVTANGLPAVVDEEARLGVFCVSAHADTAHLLSFNFRWSFTGHDTDGETVHHTGHEDHEFQLNKCYRGVKIVFNKGDG